MIARVLLWGLVAALLAWSAWAWSGLPDQIPLHFGLDGTPDRWGAPSLDNWFLIPLIGLATAALMDGIGRWSLRHPEKDTINLPGVKDLTAEQRLPVLRRSMTMILALSIVIVVALWLFQIGAFVAAHGSSSQAWALTGGILALLGPLPVLVWGLTTISAEVDRQKRGV